jgi:predicted dehydrogenase
MSSTSRRDFIRNAAVTAGVAAAAPAVQTALAQSSPNERINVAVVGFHGRGRSHYRTFAKMANVRVAALCDVDERLFPEAVADVERIGGYRPTTEFDIRRLLENKDIDAISIATPDHWHALMTVWACQAGKDVYVEKPVSFTVVEGRKMVEAARKYKRIVQAGQNMRSGARVRAAMRLLHEGKLGSVYRSKAVIQKPRGSIGRVQESSIPQGVHWDLFLGPAAYRPFNLNRFHYGWHFFWDTSTTDVGNTGVHSVDAARWGMNQRVHPAKIHSAGGVFIWDSDQETPNVQTAIFEYADGSLMEVELSNLYTPPGERGGNIFYTSKGYMTSAGGWKTALGTLTPRKRGPEITSAGVSQRANNVSFPDATYSPGPVAEADKEPTVSHFQNFIDCVRSRRVEDLYCDILEGHMSAALCHLANVSYRTGRKLVFDSDSERFVGDEDANTYLTRKYREPYVLPEKV